MRRGTPLAEVAALFLRLGLVAFGGPAAHIALMEEEVVRRRGWLTREEFLDLVGAVNLLPGPNSTELAILIGRRRAGTPGLVVAGLGFILPATGIVLGCAWAYQRYGRLPAVLGVWEAVQPVVVAVVTVALIGLARSAVRSPLLAAIGIGALALSTLGTHELMVLLLAGAAVLLLREGRRLVGAGAVFLPALGPLALATPVGTAALFLYFLKVGAVLYGSGYVLLAFLRADLVDRSGWLTEAQLLDAVAIGQITPGPVFTTATFVGYLLDGIPGGLAATCGIFLPAFLLAGVSGRLVAWIRSSPVARSFLDGVIVGSLALMAVVTWRLGRVAIDGPLAAGILLLSLGLLRLGVNAAWILLAGAVSGALLTH